MSDPVSLQIADGVAALRFERADRMNVIDMTMAECFRDTVLRALDDPTVRVLTLAGDGRSFMAGGDLGAFRTSADRPATAHAIIDPMHTALKALEAAPQISIAAIHGPVAGAGLSLALATDLCLAAEGTSLTFAYPKVAVPGDCGATHALTRLVGLRKALEIAILSNPVPADEAVRLGLVNRVVPAEALPDETGALARRIADGAPRALGQIKRLLRDASVTDHARQLDAEQQAFAAATETDDFNEALEAFFTRRKPVFTGR
jgi:2-(1,2-epoxy-1,2-dihydrophenyl)acetyl-CoA isomerase